MTRRSSKPATVKRTGVKQGLPYDTLGLDAESLKKAMLGHLEFTLAELPRHVDTEWEPYVALALAVRDRMIQRWLHTQDTYYERDVKRVYYLSLEYLMGRTLGNSLVNMRLLDECAKALHELGYELEDLREAEWDAGLGNGGLGRLAACFLDSMATLGYPVLRVRPALRLRHLPPAHRRRRAGGGGRRLAALRQPVGDRPDGRAVPRAVRRPRPALDRRRGPGSCTSGSTRATCSRRPTTRPSPATATKTVNTLRLWGAKAIREFDLDEFNEGDYIGAIEARAQSENICRVLYPSDNALAGKELRLAQEYFFVAATIQDIIRRYKKRYHMFDEPRGLGVFDRFPEKVAIQLNDTHPALAIPELMRTLVDVEGLDLGRAPGTSPRARSATPTTPSCPRRSSAGR